MPLFKVDMSDALVSGAMVSSPNPANGISMHVYHLQLVSRAGLSML